MNEEKTPKKTNKQSDSTKKVPQQAPSSAPGDSQLPPATPPPVSVSPTQYTPAPATYDSNPFTLSFNAVSTFFRTNIGWAIAFIILGFLGFLVRLIQTITENIRNGNADVSTMHSASSLNQPNISVIIAIIIVVMVLLIFAIVIGTVVQTFIQGMVSYVSLQSLKGRSVSLHEAFEATIKRFWRLFGAKMLATLKIIGWTLLFIVPGIIAALRYTLLPFVIMDEEPNHDSVVASHNRVKHLTKGKLLEVFGVATVGSIIPIVGSLVSLTGNGALYRQLQVYNDANFEKPKTHWLNYLGIILIACLLIFMLILGGILLLIGFAVSH